MDTQRREEGEAVCWFGVEMEVKEINCNAINEEHILSDYETANIPPIYLVVSVSLSCCSNASGVLLSSYSELTGPFACLIQCPLHI